MESLPPQLQFFETIHDKYDGRRMTDHNGVSILLIDYLLTTSLLLLTDPQEWMRDIRRDQINASSSCTDVSCGASDDTPGPRSSNGVPMTSASQWRKIMYGEPIYPKRNTRSLSASSSPTIPSTPPDKLAKVMHGVPIYPKLLSSAVNFDSSSDSDPEDEGSFPSPQPSGPASLPTTPGQEYSAENESESSYSSRSHGAIDNPDNSLHRSPSTSIHSTTTPSRFSQSRNTAPASPISGLASEMYRHRASYISRPRSTPPSSALPAVPDVPPPLPGPSIEHDIRRPSLPSSLNRKPTARSRPLPVPPGGSHHAWALAQQRPSGAPFPDKFGSYNSRILPSRPPQSPPPQTNAHASQHAVDAGPINPYHNPPHYYPISPYTTSPFEHPPLPPRQKTPDGTDLVQWMGELGTTSRLQPEEENHPPAAPYDVPPPPYSSIIFDK